jgi:hypothetical protein
MMSASLNSSPFFIAEDRWPVSWTPKPGSDANLTHGNGPYLWSIAHKSTSLPWAIIIH